MRVLSQRDANDHLQSIGMQLGCWHQLCDANGSERPTANVRILHVHERDALNLCHHLLAWLPHGDWKLLQLDHSSGWLDPVQMSLFSGLLYGADIQDLNCYENRGFLFTFEGPDLVTDANTSLVVSNLMYVALLLKLHAYLVSSGSRNGEMIALQDGVVYLSSRHGDMSRADALIDAVKRHPSARPKWVLDLIAMRQEQTLVRSSSRNV